MFDYSELRGRIRTVFHTEEAFAQAIGMTKNNISWRLNNKADWKAEEILRACKVLGIKKSEILKYFFEEMV